MITSIERIGSEEHNEGWFLINNHLNVQFVEDENGELITNMNFDDKVITEQEAHELAQELLQESIKLQKKLYEH